MESVNDAGLHSRGQVSRLERSALRRALAILGNPPIELVLWNGEVIRAGGAPPQVRVRISQRGLLLRFLFRPDLYFGEAYAQGDVEIDGDLVALLGYLDPLDPQGVGAPLWERLKLKFPKLAPHRLARARSNIRHHYDLGNDFYRLWLDPDLVYTCAYYPTPTASLDDAQQAKMEYVCRKLRLKPGETVVEAGCGWGAQALYMARHYGVKVRAYNISQEQIKYARERARREGLDGQVEFIEEDFSAIAESFDAFVSIGMLEHAGKDRYAELGSVLERCLERGGRGLIHSIGRDRPLPLNAWIEQNIFPGAYPPALSEMLDVFKSGAFSVLDVENLRLHYARTAEHWLARFEQSADRVEQMFDETFVRAWRFYLACAIHGFRSGWMQLFQITFARAGASDLPWTRDYLYGQGLPGQREAPFQ